jgi:predicted secreted protein
MIKPGQCQIRELCTEQSFQRGLRYFEEGRVKITEASSSRIVATVIGTDSYRVEIDLDDFSAACNCPYDLEGYCKHIVAALLAIDNEPEKVDGMMDEFSKELEKMHALLERTEPDVLNDFFRIEMKTHPDLRARFMACFSQIGEGKSLSNYKDEIGSLFDEAEGEHGLIRYGTELDFAPFENLAEIYIEKDDFLEAAKIYQALTEMIAGKMDHVDDSDGFYGGEFSHSLEALVECIKLAELGTETKKRYIDYLFNRYLLNDPDYFQDDYYDALKELCTTKEDFDHWKMLLEPHLPEMLPDDEQNWSNYYQAKRLISMQLHLLSMLKETANFYALMEKHYRSSSEFCLQYARQLLEDGDRAKAIQIAEEGITLFSDHLSKDLREFLSENYREKDPHKYKEQLLSLFLTSGEWKYYELLKNAATKEEWQKTLDKILDHFAAGGYYRGKLIEIYLREQMHDAAIREVMAQKSIPSLRTYHKKLANLYPKEYFEAYKDLIFPFAERRMGRDHYREVVSILKDMKGIKGFEYEVQQIIERLRNENRRKPAFIDEMKLL